MLLKFSSVSLFEKGDINNTIMCSIHRAVTESKKTVLKLYTVVFGEARKEGKKTGKLKKRAKASTKFSWGQTQFPL